MPLSRTLRQTRLPTFSPVHVYPCFSNIRGSCSSVKKINFLFLSARLHWENLFCSIESTLFVLLLLWNCINKNGKRPSRLTADQLLKTWTHQDSDSDSESIDYDIRNVEESIIDDGDLDNSDVDLDFEGFDSSSLTQWQQWQWHRSRSSEPTVKRRKFVNKNIIVHQINSNLL